MRREHSSLRPGRLPQQPRRPQSSRAPPTIPAPPAPPRHASLLPAGNLPRRGPTSVAAANHPLPQPQTGVRRGESQRQPLWHAPDSARKIRSPHLGSAASRSGRTLEVQCSQQFPDEGQAQWGTRRRRLQQWRTAKGSATRTANGASGTRSAKSSAPSWGQRNGHAGKAAAKPSANSRKQPQTCPPRSLPEPRQEISEQQAVWL